MSYVEKETFYLVVSRKTRGVGLQGRLTARTPALARNELALELNIRIPRALFEKPALQASITVPNDAPVGSQVITAEMADNVADLLRQQTGLHVSVSVPDVGVKSDGD